jgi:pyruvate/2-oxoglutarate dehydrogenase complex dihydrolipoamide dehydrogenase (E3) component
MPDIPGLADAKPMTHIEALDLRHLTSHLIVLGGGYVGLELAQAFRRFGARVTIIERSSQVAAAEDPDVSQAIRESFTRDGIEAFLGTQVERSRDAQAKLYRSTSRPTVENRR